jgi:hypothetical protein
MQPLSLGCAGGSQSGGAALGAGRRMAGSAFAGLAHLGRATYEEVAALEARRAPCCCLALALSWGRVRV